MSNIQSVSVSTPFSAASLDAANGSAEELDPRFVEELQGAMGQLDPEPATPSAAADTSSQEADALSRDTAPNLQNLPLMPWLMVNVPANFAPETVSNGTSGDPLRVDALAVANALDAVALQPAVLSAAQELPTMPNTGGNGPAAPDGSMTLAADGAESSGQATTAINPQTTGLTSQASVVMTEPVSVPPVVANAAKGSLSQMEPTPAMAPDATQGPSVSPPLTQIEQASARGPAVASLSSSTSAVTTSSTDAALTTTASSQSAMVSTVATTVSQGSAEAPAPSTELSPSVMRVSTSAVDAAAVSTPSTRAGTAVLSSQDSAASAALVATASTASPVETMTALDASGPVSVLEPHADAQSPATQVQSRMASQDGALVLTPSGSDLLTAGDSLFNPSVTTAQTPIDATLATPPGLAATASAVDSSVQSAAAAGTAVPTPATTGATQRQDAQDQALEQASLARDRAETPDVLVPDAKASGATATAAVSSVSSPSTDDPAQDPQPGTDKALAASVMTAHGGSAGSVHVNDVQAAATPASAGTSALPTSLTMSAQALEAEGAAATARTGGAAESTFASSFVQALMGHAHAPTTPHSQTLEVVPAPVPIAPHQVRFDAGQVQVEVVRLVKQGGGQVVMELTPPDESKFKIDLSISQQGIARLVVDGASESTRLRLEQTVSSLQEQFQQMGLQLQLDMRQPQQQHAQARPDPSGTPDLPGTARSERSDAQPTAPASGRPVWEQSQVYLVA
ncbi:MAG: hypothetical protein RJA69_858 [Pseudomonadota bacterium]|jgi:hypothetical protein